MDIKDRKRLEKFILIADRIFNSRFIKETRSIKMQINIEIGKPVEQKIEGLDEDLMRSALIDIRKLLLPKDGIKFTDICNLIIKTTADKKNEEETNGWLRLYDGLMNNIPPVHIVTGQKLHKNDKVIENWLYGYYLHDDEAKTKELESMGFLLATHKYIFVSTILTLARFAYGLSKQARIVLAEQTA